MNIPNSILSSLPKLNWAAAIDIAVVALIVYNFILIVRGRRAANILMGVGTLAGVYLASSYLHLELLRTLLATLAPYTALALVVMFQSEIRRLLARIGRRRMVGFGTRVSRRETIDEILLAVQQLASTRTGALIVLERDIGLRTFVESGVPMDSLLSRDLLLAIFQHGGSMHDGAVIVQGERVAAAACFLPLTMNPNLARYLGTRHRAAIGVTEETDCISVIVSEETGRISIATFGEIETDLSIERLEHRLMNHLGRRAQETKHFRPSTELDDSEEVREL